MSLLIKGEKMPPSCRYCAFRHMSLTQNAFCTATHETIDYIAERTRRLDNCPLIEVPTHGPLMDKNEFRKVVEDLPNCHNGFSDTYDKACIIGLIDEMPTIIEAEEGEKE